MVDIASVLPRTSLKTALSPDTATRIASYADSARCVFGREYLSTWYQTWRTSPGQTPTIMMCGDSTTVGNGSATAAYQPYNIVPTLLLDRGLTATVVQRGFSGKTTADWLATYAPAEILLTQPAVYIAKWGLNDPFAGLTVAQTIANTRAALAILRGAWSAQGTSIILMTPNTSCDDADGRNEAWHETVREGLAQAARDYGCVFIDTYGYLRDCRYNVWSGTGPWIDAAFVHPNEDHYMMIYGLVADVLAPPALQAMRGAGANVGTLAAGLALGIEPLQSLSRGRFIGFNGFLDGSGSTIATGTRLCVVAAQHRPGYFTWLQYVTVWNGATATDAANWERVPVTVSTNGDVTLMAATTLNVARIAFDGITLVR